MCVAVRGVLSSQRRVTSGVPQGSVLGPILFLVFVNFLTHGLTSNYGAFADNYKIYLHYQHGAELDGIAALQNDLNRLTAVATSWNMSLNKVIALF